MKYFEDLKKTKIFSFMTEFEYRAMMYCFKTRFKNFNKGEVIVEQGEPMHEMVMIVKGAATVQNVGSLGDISILTKIKHGDIYGLESAFANEKVYKDTLIATEKTLVMLMDKHRVITPCENKCRRHEIVTKHVMMMVAESSIELLNKISHMSRRTIREKLMSYFSYLSQKSESNYFEIPFNKTELANYLSVDRSAMSTELKRMVEDGLIDFDKRQFHLIKGKDM